METVRIWHYTVAATLLEIVESGVIRLQSSPMPGVKPVVWFSTNPHWEGTATKIVFRGGVPMQFESFESMSKHAEQRNLVFTPARIEVVPSIAQYRWKEYKNLSGANGKQTKGLYDRALEMGGRPSEWRWTFEEVPASNWMSIEIYRNGAWMVVSRAELEPYRDANPAIN